MPDINKTLNIVVDESGLFWSDQRKDVLSVVSFAWRRNDTGGLPGQEQLEYRLTKLGFPGIFHTAPLIHGNAEYADTDIEIRRQLFRTFGLFLKKSDIETGSFVIDPQYHQLPEQQEKSLLSHLVAKYNNAAELVEPYAHINLHYDAGQPELIKTLTKFIGTDPRLRLIISQQHKSSRVFHAADYATFVDKLLYKISHKLPLSKTERQFFDKKLLKIISPPTNRR